ncbi:protein trichome birefringence-like 39 [Capsicum annuum]|uniref:protein trichome birefringence-like 39 n=1 Tax=Capsicum annuum TaxID=4072 RepID=UPI001FB12C62|nr:protein trichome birefringence-like 39 [Capsicum annuum]
MCFIVKDILKRFLKYQSGDGEGHAANCDYGVEIVLFHSNLLVDIEVESVGRVLKLDSIKSGQIWREFDLLIFNTWLWWDFVEVGGKLLKDMNRVEAFRAGLNTWARWVDTDVDTAKTKVFFQRTSPAHYQ